MGHSEFTPLQIEILEESQCAIVLRTQRAFSHTLGLVITVKPGTLTDFASIPRLFHRVISPLPWNLYTIPAVFHDALYRGTAEISNGRQVTRLQADQVFLEFMEKKGVPLATRQLMYRAVRLGGGKVWKKYRKR